MREQVAALVTLLAGAGILGTVMPLAVSVIVQTHWPRPAKAAAAIGVSAVAGTLEAWGAGQLNGLAWPAAVLVAIAASQVTYRRWWRGTEIAQWIEQKTTVRGKTIDGEVVSSSAVDADAGA